MIKKKSGKNWGEFKAEVGARFGLTSDELTDAFFAMSPGPGETTYDFLLRVEDKRSLYELSPESCYYNFVNKLPPSYKQKLGQLQEMKAMAGSLKKGECRW